MSNIDLQIFYAINNLAGNYKFVDTLGTFIAGYGGILLMVVLIITLWFMDWGLPRLKNRYAVVLALEAMLVSAGLVSLIRLLYVRARPFVDHTINLLIQQNPLEPGFPSRHAAVAFALAVPVLLYNRKAGAWLFFLAILVGIGRVFVGVHYPFDIVGGLVLAVLVTLFLNFFRSFFVAPVVKLLSRE